MMEVFIPSEQQVDWERSMLLQHYGYFALWWKLQLSGEGCGVIWSLARETHVYLYMKNNNEDGRASLAWQVPVVEDKSQEYKM